MHQRSLARPGFTIIELFFAIVGLVLGIAAAMAPMGHARQQARELKDSTHIRGIIQANAIWAQNMNERYPTPSRVDLKGVTLPRPEGLQGRDLSLDTTGNTLSLLIFNGFIPTELTVSPAEAGNVQVMDDYQYANPTTAVNPAQSLWDPAFRGTPLDAWGGRVPGKVGDASHNSYAQVAYFGAREHMWGNTFSAVEASMGNRGPAYTLDRGIWMPLRNSAFGDGSITNQIHGAPDTWEGNIGFNDQHVELLTEPDPDSLVWTFPQLENQLERTWPDNIFHSENDADRQPIDERIEFAVGRDGRGFVTHTGRPVGKGALDQKNNYLRPIASVTAREGGVIEAQLWID